MIRPSQKACSRCGQTFPGDGVHGLCPRCLGDVAFTVDEIPDTPIARPSTLNSQPSTELRRFGDYELIEEIARGGMGVVFKARQISLDRIVALKLLLSGQFASPDALTRFRAEALIAARLRHPNIVPVYDVGEANGQPFLAMEFVAGKNLADVVRDHPLPSHHAAELVRTIAEAVQHAHEHGVLHRDLKPSNVLLDESGQPRVTDFGLAKRLVGTCSTASVTSSETKSDAVERVPTDDLTLTGQVLGSPSFIAPEQASGKRDDIGPGSDVYSLGALLYHLVTGRAPFQAATVTETLREVMEREPVSPRLLMSNIPRDLETLCLKCLEKEPRKRYAVAQDLAGELGRFLNGEPIHARPTGPTEKLWRWCCRKPALAASLAAVFLLLLTVAIISTTTAVRIERARAGTAQAQRETTTNLWASYLAQARANRFSGRPGRRFDSLDVLAKAAAIRPSPELRDEAIACLSLIDLRPIKQVLSDTPDGTSSVPDALLARYAVGLPSGEISVRQRQDDLELLRLPASDATLRRVLSFSNAGRLLAARYENGSLRVWDLQRRQVAATGRCADSVTLAGWSIHFSPDDREVAIADGSNEVVILSLPGGARRSITVPSKAHVVRYSPDGVYLAVGSQSSPTVVVLEAVSGKTVVTFQSGDAVGAMVWHPEGSLLALDDTARKVTVWNWRRGEPVRSLTGHNENILSLAFHPNGRILLSGGWEGILVWDYITGERILTLPGSTAGMCFSPDGTRLFKRRPTKAEFTWCEMSDGSPVRSYGVRSLEEPRAYANATAFTPDGAWLFSLRKSKLSIHDVATSRLMAEASVGDVDALSIDASTNLWISSLQGLSRWPVSRNATSNRWMLGPPEPVGASQTLRQVTVSRDGRTLATIHDNDHVHVLDPTNGRELGKTKSEGVHVYYLALSSNGERLATGTWEGKGACIWEARTGKLLRRIGDDTSHSQGSVPAFSDDDHWLFVVCRNGVSAWNTKSWDLVWQIPKEDEMMVMALAPDASVLAVRHQKNIFHLLAPESGTRLATLESPNGDHVTSLIFSPDSTRLAMQGSLSRELFVWDLRSLRRHLATMNLDWDMPAYPPATADVASPPVQIEIVTQPAQGRLENTAR